MSIYNVAIQCRPCLQSRPLGEFEKERLVLAIKAAEEAREAQQRFLKEQDEREKFSESDNLDANLE